MESDCLLSERIWENRRMKSEKLRMEITLFTNAVIEISELKGVSNKDKAESIYIAEQLFHSILSRHLVPVGKKIPVPSFN